MSAAPSEEPVKEAPPVQQEAAQDAADLFGGLKKKSKKKKIPVDFDLGEVRSHGPESNSRVQSKEITKAEEPKTSDAPAETPSEDVAPAASTEADPLDVRMHNGS